ncbi:Uncharacterized protein APZ42_014053 [Daphnia magna]|uniref:Uncharacterized protein n=1 Tax=Daphnia magna TaxID=35525 RepID=A0A162QAI4_9CRUS|nr:Uncharacterized protein APZ42_014053 [Daphnia magna]
MSHSLIFVLHPCLHYSNVFLCLVTTAMLLRQKKNGDLMSICPLITLKLILVNLLLNFTTWMSNFIGIVYRLPNFPVGSHNSPA